MSVTSIKHGVYGGLVGGVVFGAMMGLMGMLSMVGGMVGVPSAWVGFVVHMAISAMIGATFSAWLAITGLPGGVATGLGYGLAWWIVGPLTLMPLFMGMGLGANWSVAAMQQRSGPRNLDSGLSEISIVFQAAVPKLVASKYTTSGVRRPREL